MYYLCRGNKGADQLRDYHAADLHLCFAYSKSRFSHDATQIGILLEISFYNRIKTIRFHENKEKHFQILEIAFRLYKSF